MARTEISTQVKRYATLGGKPVVCIYGQTGVWLQQGGNVVHLFPSEYGDLCDLLKDTIDRGLEEQPLLREE